MPLLKPAGAEKLGLACAAKYSPETIAAAEKDPVALYVQHGLNVLASWFNVKMNDFERLRHLNSLKDHGALRGRCTKNIILFARDTSEFDFAGLGEVERTLARRLKGDNWSMVDIPYDADIIGDFCLGLPGGMVARDVLNQAAGTCPDANWFVSGYSQGGMVSHNAVAYASDGAKKHVAVSRPKDVRSTSTNRERLS